MSASSLAGDIAKPGDTVTFVCGPGEFPNPKHATRKGIAYGIIRTHFGNLLRVKLDDFTFETVFSFSTIGIGSYHFPKEAK
jgi:hypothetical protein